MAKKTDPNGIPLLNTTISEMPVNDLPIDTLTKDRVAELSKHNRHQPQSRNKVRP